MKMLIGAALILGLQFTSGYDRDYAAHLEEALLYELKPLAYAFVEAEQKYGVSAVMLSSIAAIESGWGRHCFAENNIFGFGQKSFESKEACIDYVASYLRLVYLTPGGRCFRGYALEDIAVSYCPDTPEWAPAVRNVMDRIENRMRQSFIQEVMQETLGREPRPSRRSWDLPS